MIIEASVEVTARNYDVSFTIRDRTSNANSPRAKKIARRAIGNERNLSLGSAFGNNESTSGFGFCVCENMRTTDILTHDLFSCIPPIFVPCAIIPGRSTDVATSGEPFLVRTNVSHEEFGKIVKAARELFSPMPSPSPPPESSRNAKFRKS